MTSKEWYDLHAVEYDASYEGKKWVEIYDRITWDKTIKPYLPINGDAQILDAGGGTGKWTIPICKLGYHVTLTDISESMLKVAKQKLSKENLLERVRIVVADIVRMNMFEDETFDLVLCEGDPLSYCTDPLQGIEEIIRVAKKGSFIVASVDNLYPRIIWGIRQGLLDQVSDLFRTQRAIHNFPIYFFKPSELMRDFEERGCKIEKIIGKNIFSSGLEEELKDPAIFKRILELELEHCADPNLVGFAGHFAVVCSKK